MARRDRHRLDFLDALRGLAALSVAFAHRAQAIFSGFGQFNADTFRVGTFGVVLFFLCSGFIIPASLERYGSLRRFWVSRFFRLFPLYWFAIAACVLLYLAGRYRFPGGYTADPVGATLVNLTMLQAFVHEPLAIGLSWTLAFEMFFYFIVSALFAVGLHRKSLSLAAPAVGAVASLGLANAGAPKPVVGIALLVTLGLGIRLVLAAPGQPQRIGFVLVPLLALCVLFNGYYEAWKAALLLTTMFLGTALYRWTSGEQPARRVVPLFLAGTVVAIVAATNDALPSTPLTVGAAYALFLAALGFRHRSFPRPVVYLGVISYSLYLLHPLVYAVVGTPRTRSVPVEIVALLGGVALAAVLSMLTFRWLEQPLMVLGRRVATGRPSSAPLGAEVAP